MGSVIVNTFRGMESRDQKVLKANTFAECAINASLQDGALAAIPCPEEISTHAETAKLLVDTPECGIRVVTAEGYVERFQGRTYIWTAGGRRESYSNEDFCVFGTGESAFGMPAPTAAPGVTNGTTSGSRFEPRQYMYTFVSKRGDCVVESPPSPVSVSSNCADTAAISGLQTGDPAYNVTHIRLYRFDAGWKSGSESKVQNNSGALLVAELPNGTTNYTDNNPLSNPDMIGLLTYDMESMPANPDGIGSTAFSIFSWQGKELYISTDGMPELRRKNGRFAFDHDIITAKYWQGSIYVFTERYNYRIDESAGDGGVSYSNPPFKFEKVMPIRNKFSVSVGSSGVFYHTAAGIGVLAGNSTVLISTGILNTTQWKSYISSRVKTMVYQQYLFIYSREWSYAHIFEFEDGISGDRPFSNHVLYPYSIHEMAITNDGNLIFSADDAVYQFVESDYCPAFCFDEQRIPACTECCPYDYRMMITSQAQITDYAMGYIRIDPQYGNVKVSLIDRGCGDVVVFEETFAGCTEHQFRLPTCHLSEEHMIKLEGCAKVFEIRLGTSAKELGLNR